MQKPVNELGKSYVDFMRCNVDQLRQKITDELYTLSALEVAGWLTHLNACMDTVTNAGIHCMDTVIIRSSFIHSFTHTHGHTNTKTFIHSLPTYAWTQYR